MRMMGTSEQAGRWKDSERAVTLAVVAGLLSILASSGAYAQNAAQRAALARLGHAHSQAVPSNGAEATTISLDSPSGLAFDATGNLYIADTDDNIILEVNVAGIVNTVAGNGVQGFAGDGGMATSAQLDTPIGIAVDSNSNLYIADSHNNRIREVSGGTITTIVGTGTAGFSGDGSAATSAMLDRPTAVCVDSKGDIYVADTNNNRIREITAGVINTVAGNGQQMFSGDGGVATSASLDSPNGVAVDGQFNIYISDTHNQRIRMVAASSGIITTLAGTGAESLTPDGPAPMAAFANPRGLAVDSNGAVYVADTNNELIRTISNGAVTTIAGNGTEGFNGDRGASTSASLDDPRAVAVAGASVVVADTDNNLIRTVSGGTVNTIGGQGNPGTEQIAINGVTTTVYGTGSLTATFSNGSQTGTGTVTFYDGLGSSPPIVGTASLTSNTATFSTSRLPAGTHYLVASYAGDTKNAPVVSGVYIFVVTPAPLTAVANAVSMLYGQAIPVLSGTLAGVLAQDSGNVTALFSTTATATSTPATYPITAALSGSAAGNYTVTLGAGSGSVTIAKAPTVTTLAASSTTPVLGTSATLTATIASTTSGTPTGTVNFFNGSVQLNSNPVALSGGIATLNVTTLPVGTINLTAAYSGDADYTASTSSLVTGTVLSPDFGVAATPATQSVLPSQSVNYAITVTPTNATFVFPVTLSASGLPNGVTATFTPSSTIASGAAASTVEMTLSAAGSARMEHQSPLRRDGPITALALFFLPLALNRRFRRNSARLSSKARLMAALLALAAAATLSGCGGGGFFGHSAQSYTVTVTAVSGPDTHATTVTLTVQ
jgi:sugar lactone lactonase YvrE